MRDYQVPFNTREEAPFIMGVSIREMLWLGAGFMVGLLLTVLIFSLMKTGSQSMFFSLPAIIPSVGASFVLAKKKVREDDHFATLDRHWLKYFKYRIKPHIFLNYRREV